VRTRRSAWPRRARRRPRRVAMRSTTSEASSCFATDHWAPRFARYAPHLDNLRAAIAWSFGSDGDDDTSIALVGSSAQLWLSLSLYAEAGAWVHRALERLAPSTPPALEADLWLAVARFHGQRNQQATIRASRRAADLPRPRRSLRRGCALHALVRPRDRRTTRRAGAARGANAAKPLGRPRLVAMAHSGTRCSRRPWPRTTPSGNCRPPWRSIAPRRRR
jgi:hypothetical protein